MELQLSTFNDECMDFMLSFQQYENPKAKLNKLSAQSVYHSRRVASTQNPGTPLEMCMTQTVWKPLDWLMRLGSTQPVNLTKQEMELRCLQRAFEFPRHKEPQRVLFKFRGGCCHCLAPQETILTLAEILQWLELSISTIWQVYGQRLLKKQLICSIPTTSIIIVHTDLCTLMNFRSLIRIVVWVVHVRTSCVILASHQGMLKSFTWFTIFFCLVPM